MDDDDDYENYVIKPSVAPATPHVFASSSLYVSQFLVDGIQPNHSFESRLESTQSHIRSPVPQSMPSVAKDIVDTNNNVVNNINNDVNNINNVVNNINNDGMTDNSKNVVNKIVVNNNNHQNNPTNSQSDADINFQSTNEKSPAHVEHSDSDVSTGAPGKVEAQPSSMIRYCMILYPVSLQSV